MVPLAFIGKDKWSLMRNNYPKLYSLAHLLSFLYLLLNDILSLNYNKITHLTLKHKNLTFLEFIDMAKTVINGDFGSGLVPSRFP